MSPCSRSTLFGALRRDVRGNTLALMAAALIPLIGMVGGGIDISRMYLVKTRLQHACDAGALAGRRSMGGGTWGYASYAARGQAEQFFDANYDRTAFGVAPDSVTRLFSESAGRVTGTAQAVLPMTLMRVFGKTTETLAVTCSSEMRLPNTDVMFVLDTTGSMADPQPGDSVSKMDALKTAVKCFYEIVTRLDSNAVCTTGTPSGGVGDQVQVRFGFVPYSTNVNVGKLLPPAWFADSWDYQTRTATYATQNAYSFPPGAAGGGAVTSASDGPVENATGYSADASKDRNAFLGLLCLTSYTPDPTSPSATGPESDPINVQTTTAGSAQTVTWQTTQRMQLDEWRYAGLSNGKCRYEKRTVTFTRTRSYVRTDAGTLTPTQVFSGWRYARLPVNVGLLKNGSEWKPTYSFDWPIGASASPVPIRWDGCIEERRTVRATSYTPLPTDAADLDIDLVPHSEETRWKPALPQVEFTRGDAVSGNRTASWIYNEVTTTADYRNPSQYFCPTEARLMQSWPSASAFDNYVDSLTPSGNTYHDIGLIWGARLLSPTGLFKAQNAFTPKGGEIERHLIFMTDGDACAQPYDYTAYGLSWFDRRQTSETAVPTGGCTFNSATLVEQVNKRTEGLCAAIRNKNITLWVIAFGNLATETETRLQGCATPSRYFKATNAAQLQATFKAIADQISMLRLTN